MFTKKGLISIFIAGLILSFSLSLISNLENFSLLFFVVILVIFTNILFKEFAAYYYDLKIEHSLWEIKRYGVSAHSHFKKAFPIGAILPLITCVLSAGYLVWLNILTFEAKPEVYRVAKRRGFYHYSETSEFHVGFVALFGVIGNILLGVVGILLNFPLFTQLSFFYAFFCTIPIGKLDGNKILFSEIVVWMISIILTGALSLFVILF
jgi:hypothetical protein